MAQSKSIEARTAGSLAPETCVARPKRMKGGKSAAGFLFGVFFWVVLFGRLLGFG